MYKMISIIIPTFNRPDYLKDAINSVLMQSYQSFEVIVIDDNSTQDMVSIVNDYNDSRLTCIRNEVNRGPGYNRKKGFELSKGDYIIFMDDDDYYTDIDFFEKVINVFGNHKDIIFVSSNAQVYNVQKNEYTSNKLNVQGRMMSTDYLRYFSTKYSKPLSTFTTVFERLNLISSGLLEMNMVNDMVIYMKSLRNGNVYFMEDFIGVYRVHDSNISNHITLPFLLDNLREKRDVYIYIKENKLFEDYERWWYEHIKITAGYFFYESNPGLFDVLELRRWCIDNSYSSFVKENVKFLFETYMKQMIYFKFERLLKIIKKGKE